MDVGQSRGRIPRSQNVAATRRNEKLSFSSQREAAFLF